MIDRNVEFPNRYRMVKVERTDDIVDLIPAPGEISDEGTFINKATLLKDATAAIFGLGSSGVPDEVFSYLGKYNQHWWSVLHGAASTGYEEKRTNITADVAIVSNGRQTISWSKSITIDQSTGAVFLENPQTIEMNSLSSSVATESCKALADLVPVYITGLFENSSKIYYIPAGATWGNTGFTFHGKTFGYWYDGDSDYYLELAGEYANVYAQEITSQIYNIPAGATTYVYSTDRSAYPDSGTVDGLTYQYLGVPFDNAVTAPKIATGSYAGTGTYGSSNPCSLTFNFVPKFLYVKSTTYVNTVLFWFYGDDYSIGVFDNSSYYHRVTLSGKTLSWYCAGNGNSAYYQCNNSGTVYNYIAFG